MNYYNNGRSPGGSTTSAQTIAVLRAALRYLDSHCDYNTWFRIGAAIHTITNGGADGLDLYLTWSSTSPQYRGPRSVEYQWQSFGRNRGNRMGMPTLRRFVEQTRTEWATVLAEASHGDEGLQP